MNQEEKAQEVAACLRAILDPQRNQWRLGTSLMEMHWGPSSESRQARAEKLAKDFAADGRFQALRLGTWLGTPDGALLARAVEIYLPPPYNHDASIVVEGLKLAAQAQHEQAWNTMFKKFGIGIGVSLVAVGIGGMFN